MRVFDGLLNGAFGVFPRTIAAPLAFGGSVYPGQAGLIV
jgi:hypothetical protein